MLRYLNGDIGISVDDLKANTEYTGYTAASSVVQWFWEVVKCFNKEDMARLLQFVTGTSKVDMTQIVLQQVLVQHMQHGLFDADVQVAIRVPVLFILFFIFFFCQYMHPHPPKHNAHTFLSL